MVITIFIKGETVDKITHTLFDWTFHFIKNKDIILRKIVSVQEYINQGYIFVEYKDKRMVYFIVPFIDDFGEIWKTLQGFKKSTDSSNSCIVLYNNRDNLDTVIQNWKIVDKDPTFQLVFANPYSLGDKRWIVVPYTHSKIIEPDSLKTGLKSLFETVDQISELTLKKMIK